MTNSTTGWVTVSVLDIDGSTVLASHTVTGSNYTFPALTLPNTGTDTIKVDPYQAATGTTTLTLSQGPAKPRQQPELPLGSGSNPPKTAAGPRITICFTIA